VPALGADGFNGDTMYGVPSSFYNCSRPIVATPEGGVPTAFLRNNPISWGYYFGYAHFPPVARAKFLEPRHMVQVCARWSLDRTAELQTAFFNGVGYVVWENVWGIWNGMTDRESESTKRAFKILRAFAFATTSPAWQPYFSGLLPARRLDGVFASEFPIDNGDGGWFYTVISTATETKTIMLPIKKHLERLGRVRVYDAYHGIELKQQKQASDAVFASFSLEPRGFGAIYVAPAKQTREHPMPANLSQFLDEMSVLTVAPLRSFSNQRPLLQQKIVEGSDRVSASTPFRRPIAINDSSSSRAFDSESARTLGDHDQKQMVRVRGADNWWFNVSSVQIEPVHAWTPDWLLLGAGVQFPWEHRPWNNHSVRLMVQDFFIDRYPITNIEFARFLQESRYSPQSLDRFLAHWDSRIGNDSSRYKPLSEWKVPPSLEKSPVVNVAREDAEAFAAFYGKRLPHDWEWQYVASNGDKFTTYPWGNDYDANRLPRVIRNGEEAPPLPDAVGSYPHAQSTAFGVDDLVGFVWQMTDRFCDDHTCGMLLRGGSYFRPVASTLSDPNWYFPQALQSQQHNRFLMLSQSYDRSPFIGFRCVKSARSSDDIGYH
jgi:iron(II)-dependent oxidoreductase